MKLPVYYDNLSSKDKRKVRDEYTKLQEGKCFYCKHPLNGSPPNKVISKTINWKLFPSGFMDYPVHLQHNHETGLTEGAVHAYCNAVMWQYEGR